ncbi:MAG TPA: glycoside hydrolase family 38 C-terminal domain-containing protein, partial [Bacteroidota bacterium]|nr:glycoside hydrolase family 38 C-terminal domain-containing protein [Bacteroidota bacterium]
AINTGGPLRLLRAELRAEMTSNLRKSIEDFSLSLRVAQKLLSFDTYQTNATKKEDPGIDKSQMDRNEKLHLNTLLENMAMQVDVDALGRGSIGEFNSSLNRVRNELKPIKDFAKRFTLFFDANAHIDAAWLWREKETVEVCKNTFSSVLDMMDARPDFTYTQSSAAYYDWMERFYPDVFKRIQQRVNDGRWEIIGGMWVEPDCNLPSGESWMRHILYAKRYFKKKFGIDVNIGWNPDSFGYNWNMPQFYTNSGIDAFVTQKIGWNEKNVFPHRVFWWEAPNGSRILTYFPYDYVSTVDNPYRLVDWLRQFEANTGLTQMMILFGVGDHGGGPSMEMLDRINYLKSLDIYPDIQFGKMKDYLSWLKEKDATKFPIWKDELYLEYHQGTYTTQANIKKLNRESEVLLINAEKFSTISTLFGKKYNQADLEDAWRNILFNQFHDILPGSGIREIYMDAAERYHQAEELGRFELNQSLEQIAKSITTSSMKKGKPLIVFNSLSWNRSDIVAVELPKGDAYEYSVFDLQGREIPSQIIQKEKYRRELIFSAQDVPSIGYKVYELRQRKPSKFEGTLLTTDMVIENEFFRIEIDPSKGWIKSIVDKRVGREILKGYGNELQLLEDKPSAWDAWNIGLTGVKYPMRFRRAEIVERGPIRSILRVTFDYLKPGTKKDYPTEDFPTSFFTQEIVLYTGIDRIDFATDVDWWEEKTMLKVSFPVSVSDADATYEIPYGTIQRSTLMNNQWDSAKVEVPAQRWADLSQSDYGVTLLNRTKYGYDIKENIIRLSLLRSPKWPDPTADRGKHSIEYALYPHTGTWREANTVRRGYEYNYPLIPVVTDNHKGTLPSSSNSFAQLSPSNLILTTIKRSEEGDAWIIQWYESHGEDTDATLTLPKVPQMVQRSNFLENDGESVLFTKNQLTIKTTKYSIVTIKVHF